MSFNRRFLSCAGSIKVPVADCSKRSFSAHPKEEWTVDEFLHYWKADLDSRQSPAPKQHDSNNGRQIFYLKDWHYARLEI